MWMAPRTTFWRPSSTTIGSGIYSVVVSNLQFIRSRSEGLDRKDKYVMESTNTPWTGRDQRAAEDEIILEQPEIDEEDLLEQPAPVQQRREPPSRVEQRRDQPAIIESTIQPPLPKNQRPKGRRNR